MGFARDKTELEALVARMRIAAKAGLSMGEFAAAEGMSRSAVAGVKHRHGITFVCPPEKQRALAQAAARKFWGAKGKREHERRTAPPSGP